MKILQYIYKGDNIDFAMKENQSVMINATQMAGIFNKRTDHFLKSDHAKNYIKALEEFIKMEINQTPNGVRIISKVVENRGRNGVFFERRLALKFAAWLDVSFELWIYSTIDKIILGSYKEHKEATVEKIKAKEEAKQKKKELLKEFPRFIEYLELEGKVSEADRRRAKALKATVKEIQMEFFPDS